MAELAEIGAEFRLAILHGGWSVEDAAKSKEMAEKAEVLARWSGVIARWNNGRDDISR